MKIKIKIKKPKPKKTQRDKASALHECAHGLIAVLEGVDVEEVVMFEKPWEGLIAQCRYDPETHEFVRYDLDKEFRLTIAGDAAEEIFTGREIGAFDGSMSDFESMLKAYCYHAHKHEGDVFYSDQRKPNAEDYEGFFAKRTEVKESVKVTLRQHWSTLEALAEALAGSNFQHDRFYKVRVRRLNGSAFADAVKARRI